MNGSDFGMGAIANLAIVGLVFLALLVIASPLVIWWLWNHVSVVVR